MKISCQVPYLIWTVLFCQDLSDHKPHKFVLFFMCLCVCVGVADVAYICPEKNSGFLLGSFCYAVSQILWTLRPLNLTCIHKIIYILW